MRRIWISKVGPPEVLVVREAPDPIPGPQEVVVNVHAAGVNFADVMARIGIYPDAPKLPAVVGYEVSGTVASVGKNVQRFHAGDRVVALCRFGGYSEKIALPEAQVFPLPENISFEQGAAIPVNYLTAYQSLQVMGGISAGDRVLIHSAGGGVGLAAIDLCRLMGAEVLAIASEGKHDRLRQRGVEVCIDGRKQDWEKAVKEATGGRGVELVLDPNGGASWKQSYDCLAPTGRLVVYGFAAAAAGPTKKLLPLLKTVLSIPWFAFNPLALIDANKGVLGVNMGHLWDEGDRVHRWFETILQRVADGNLTPHVDKAFAFAEAPEAHRYLQERKNFGKVVLVP